MKKNAHKNSIFERFSTVVSKATGSSAAFVIAIGVVLAWAISGPFLDFSETWQLLINTTTTIVTFLMVFLIQKAQNKDSMAIQLKLNELVASQRNASNRLVDVEDLSEQEMKVLHKYYEKLSKLSEKENSLLKSHSVDEAAEAHKKKVTRKKAGISKPDKKK